MYSSCLPQPITTLPYIWSVMVAAASRIPAFQKKLYISSPSLSFPRKLAAMATNTKISMHSRSNSVPSAPHPLVSQFDEHLLRLKASRVTSSSSLIGQKLDGLKHLHDCADKMLQLPITRRALAQECSRTCIDELLEGSLKLLDMCDTAKDALLHIKESLRELQSAVRRRRGGEMAFRIEGGKYLSSRKTAKKAIQKALKNLNGIEKEAILTSSNKDNLSLSMISNIKEAEVVTLTQIEFLLYFVYGSEGQPKQSKWSVVSKLMQPKRVGCDLEKSNTNEFEKVDIALQSLLSHKPCSIVSIEIFQNHMENLELCIQALETGIEQLQRHMIGARVSLLNIYNQ